MQNPPKQGKKKINKADIGKPVPISIPKKFAVRVEDLLDGLDKASAEHNHTEDPYTSCSECGYQSLCGSVCSCSLAGSLRRRKGEKEKSGESSGCSSCECSECREAGDVCYSCSLYNESQGTVRSRIQPATSSPLPAPDTPLTAWRKAMLASQINDERLEAMAGMSSNALPQPKNPRIPTRANEHITKATIERSVKEGSQPKTPRSTTKTARRQFRAVQRVQEAEGLSSSSESPAPRPRPPRSLSSSHTTSPRQPASSSRPLQSSHSSASRPPPPTSRPPTSASSRPRPPSSNAMLQLPETPPPVLQQYMSMASLRTWNLLRLPPWPSHPPPPWRPPLPCPLSRATCAPREASPSTLSLAPPATARRSPSARPTCSRAWATCPRSQTAPTGAYCGLSGSHRSTTLQ